MNTEPLGPHCRGQLDITILEPLEVRIAPSTIFAVDTTNNLMRFDSATPGTIATIGPITGLVSGDSIIGIDFNPATGNLLGLGGTGHIYTIDPKTASATQFGPDLTTPLSGTGFGFDVNPVSGAIRIVSDAEQNLRIANGVTNQDAALAYFIKDTNQGFNPNIVAAAYTNNFAGATETSLYGIDSNLNVLVRLLSPNTGQLFTVGPLGVDPGFISAFDIRADGTAFAAMQVGVLSQLYTIDLETGAATLVDTIGTGTAIRSIAAVPAEVTLVNAKTATYRDVDGDIVRIKVSKGALQLDDFRLQPTGGLGRAQLQMVDFKGDEDRFDNANLKVTVTKRAAGGDGLVHVGFINASGLDLNRVIVRGDLGKIFAGDGTTVNDPGLNLLQLRSMGTLGLLTQGGGDLESTINGKLGALKVSGDFTDAILFLFGGPDAELGSVFIGGDLSGGTLENSGGILSGGAIGRVRINGNVIGGVGGDSGLVFSNESLGNVRIRGDVIGGAGDGSGVVSATKGMGDVRLDGNLFGGPGFESGAILSNEAIDGFRIGESIVGGAGDSSGTVRGFSEMGDVRIGRDLIGGAGESTGRVVTNGSMGDVRIGGDLIGSSITGSKSIPDAGEIFATGRIDSVTIGGSLIAGTDLSSGSLFRCGAIVAGDDLGPVKIGGSILGNSTNPALISARGQDVKPTTGFDVAIASLSVGGDVRFALILAGFNTVQGPANADASIGPVKVGRNWAASSLVAGVEDTGGEGFGIVDSLQTIGDTALIAHIASITIKGSVSGSLATGDHFGFVAQEIDKLKIGPRVFDLTDDNDTVPIPFTDDVQLSELG